jgi:hypothetical protein
MKIIVKMGRECKRGIWGPARGKGGEQWAEEDQSILHRARDEDSVMKATKFCLKKGRREGGAEGTIEGWTCSQCTVHTYGISTMKPPLPEKKKNSGCDIVSVGSTGTS